MLYCSINVLLHCILNLRSLQLVLAGGLPIISVTAHSDPSVGLE